MKKWWTIWLLFVGLQLSAQDPQFSQFYNSPMVINPAFTGTTDCFRVGTAARTQWFGLDKAFNTGLVYMDVNVFPINSGLGFMALYDQMGHAKVTSTELSGLYSYHVKHNNLNLQLGLQGTYANRSIDYSRLIFEDQFVGTTFTNAQTIDPTTAFTRNSYLDFSAGLLAFADDHWWFGASVHHLNTPEQSFYLPGSKLHMKYSFQAGTVWQRPVGSEGKFLNIYPTVLYKAQTTFDQLDFGVFGYYEKVMLGVFYRGLFVKQYRGVRNNDALQLHFGYNVNDWKIYYSYDITTSRLNVTNTWGTHEISISKNFCVELFPHKPRTDMKTKLLACPDFKRGTLKKRESWKTQWNPKKQRNVRPSHKKLNHQKKVRKQNLKK